MRPRAYRLAGKGGLVWRRWIPGGDEARAFYAEAIREMKRPEYKQSFRLRVSRTDQGDPDREVLAGR